MPENGLLELDPIRRHVGKTCESVRNNKRKSCLPWCCFNHCRYAAKVIMSEVFSLNELMMRMPAVFVNHGGGPMPLMGRQPMIAHHLQETVTKFITEKPRAIVVISAHHEANPIAITSSAKPSMYFDYYGFPPETYEFKYPAPGNPELARKIQNLLSEKGLESQLDAKRGLDHGAFVPLMLMYPDADVPVVCVSLHSSLSPDIHLALGSALAPLQDQGTS